VSSVAAEPGALAGRRHLPPDRLSDRLPDRLPRRRGQLDVVARGHPPVEVATRRWR
jgi:hypothetical protein